MNDTPVPLALIDDTVGDFQLVVFYAEHEGTDQYHVVVKHKDGAVRTGWVSCGWEPRFGIDVADMHEINVMAERFCVEIENSIVP